MASEGVPVAITFGENQYGKAEVRLVKIPRDSDRHQIEDLNVSTSLRGDFAAAHTVGDNAHVVATDTQKNTVYAFAQQYGVGQIEDFGLRLGRHFTGGFAWVPGAPLRIEEDAWGRVGVDGAGPRTRFGAPAVPARGRSPAADAEDVDWDKSYTDVRRILLETFAGRHSLA